MRETFVDKAFTPESRVLLATIIKILNTYAEQGYDLSLRQLYYQLVAGDLLPKKWADPKTGSTNSERSYKNIGALVSDARLAGLIDWNMIKDRGRAAVSNNHWDTPRSIIEACARQFQLNKWANQPNHVEVMVEKQALEGVLEPVCAELDVTFTANKGYSSSSALYEAGKRMAEARDDGKEVHVIYLGDHDPSGIDMSRDVEDRLRLFAGIGQNGDGDGHFELHRVALNFDQVRELNPPENPAKMTDSRADEYVRRFGRSSWELDAIEPRELARLVRDEVISLRDDDKWDEAVARQLAMRAEIEKLAKKSKFKADSE